MTEVELIENENGPRENNSALLDVNRSPKLCDFAVSNSVDFTAATRHDRSEGRRDGIAREGSLRYNGTVWFVWHA